MELTIRCRKADKEFREKKREEVIQGINKLKADKEEFENRKRHVQENNEEWTEGEFSQAIPNEPGLEVDNDLD